jgi:hypothetical protein
MSKIQKQGIKTAAELISAGATIADLPNDTQIYVTANSINKQLSQALTDGDIGGTISTVSTSTNASYYLIFVASTTNGSQTARLVSGLNYNPSTNILTTTGFSGSGASLTTLNASNLSSGTVAIARTNINTSALTESAGATTIDWSLSNSFSLTLNANLTSVTFSNTLNGQTIVVAITNTASNYTVTWGNSIKWAGGTQPVQTTGAKTDVWTIIKIGSTYYGSVVQNMS